MYTGLNTFWYPSFAWRLLKMDSGIKGAIIIVICVTVAMVWVVPWVQSYTAPTA